MNKLNRFITQLHNNIVRVAYTYDAVEPPCSILCCTCTGDGPNATHMCTLACTGDGPNATHMCTLACTGDGPNATPGPEPASSYQINPADNTVSFLNNGEVVLTEKDAVLNEKEVYGTFIDGEPEIGTKLTANGEVSYIKNAESRFERYSHSGHLTFEVGEDELLLGLGQYEDGVFDYRNHTEYLYESNMRIAMPFLITTGGYAIFIDTESNMVFNSQDRKVEFTIDTTKDIVYYVITGKDISEIIGHFQDLTGKPELMPKWVFGYVQSKERYKTGDELVETVKEFRERHIPIDCIVQDWYTWEDGLWGEKILDKKRFSDFADTVKKLHDMNVALMVSIWPNMSPQGENYKEFEEAGGLLKNSNVYNAFEPEFRELYWKQCQREIMDAGVDALWCDNSEPFSDADWNGASKRPEELRCELVVNDSKKSMEWEKLNSYGLYHAKGIWENWKKSYPDRPVVNLTRSGYVSGQKYGTILWSGDITAKWETIRKQIVEGCKMGLCGNPYWTLDIGGFFTVKDKYENRGCNDKDHKPLWFWDGDFNDGVNDPGYRELYTRWIQFGTFLPVFRSHGTDTPREPWNFINNDGVTVPFYETILKYINLRYKLLPYIYSLAEKAHTDSYIMMRSLAFDFAHDKNALECLDEYMFGDFLVCPVYEPMYYGPSGVAINNSEKTKKVYLPSGTKWCDFWTEEYYEGGQWIVTNADISTMPLFVRAGAKIPMSDAIEYSNQNGGKANFIKEY